MITEFSTYKTKIKHREFENSAGIKFESTVAITFYDNYKKEILYRELGFVSAEEIYTKITNKESINIDECYIENFSLKEYKKANNLADTETVSIIDFSAKDAIFEAQYSTDFSNVEFLCEHLSFKSSAFIKGKVDFSNTKFAKKSNDFSYCFYNDGNISFYDAIFGKEKTVFKNSVFKFGDKNFQFCSFSTGKVLFDNVDFGEGDVNFVNSDFSQGDVSFKISNFGTGKVDFHYSKFGEGKISFEKVDFGNGYVNFKMVEFSKGRVNFIKTIFGDGDIDFEGCELPKGKLTMKKATFGKGKLNFENVDFSNADLIFDHTIFNTEISLFKDSSFKSISFKSCHIDSYMDLRVRHCKFIDLSDTIVRDIIDITPYEEVSGIESFRFDGMRLLGSIHIDWYKNKVKSIIKL